jgi:hypothetical protein
VGKIACIEFTSYPVFKIMFFFPSFPVKEDFGLKSSRFSGGRDLSRTIAIFFLLFRRPRAILVVARQHRLVIIATIRRPAVGEMTVGEGLQYRKETRDRFALRFEVRRERNFGASRVKHNETSARHV